MSMTVAIDLLTGAGPTATAVQSPNAAFAFNRDDTRAGTTPIPTPTASPATKFSYVKSLQIDIVNVGGLNMTDVRVGRVQAETVTGHQLWRCTSHAAYTQAVATPADTTDNNTTGPGINGVTGIAMELISTPPAVYAAGPYNSIGRKGNIVELAWGIDARNVTTGSLTMTGGLRWSWVEA